MEIVHATGCDKQHGPRQSCNISKPVPDPTVPDPIAHVPETIATPSQPRNIGRIVQSAFLALLIGPIFAVPLHLLIGTRETRGDRLFGTAIGFCIQLVIVTVIISIA